MRSGHAPNLTQALVFLFLSARFNLDDHAIYDSYTDGGNDLGVDAIHITRFGNQPEIHVIQSKHYTSERKAANPFKISAARKFRDFLLTVKNREADLSKISNAVLESKIKEIREIQEREFPIFKLWLVSNGHRCVAREFDGFASELLHLDAELNEFHLSEFYDFCIAGKSKRTDHSFFAASNDVIEFGLSGARGLSALLSARELFALMSDITEANRIDFGLFSANIRGFLGSDNPINRQIYRTAVSDSNSRFWCLNNGITMTCSRYQVRRLTERPKIGAKDLRIVNGAQTCGAIFKAIIDYSSDFERFKNLAISFRLFETEDPNFVDEIAISSNSQNRVSARDLKANHPYQYKTEEELERRGIRYLRKRGSTRDYESPDELGEGDREIDALKVGQVLLSYALEQPDRAKRDSDSVFEEMYEAIFAVVDYDELEFAIGLYWRIMRMREFVEDEIRLRGRTRVPRDFVTYGAFHVLFACRELLRRIPSLRDHPDQLVEQALDLVQSVLERAGSPAFYVFFRKPGTASLIAQHGMQMDFFSLLKTAE